MLVIDASAALHAAGSHDGFGQFTAFGPVAPPLMWSEAFSVLHEVLWRGAMSKDLALVMRSRLESAPIDRRDPEELHQEAWKIAKQLGWAKTYDAEYVALARLLGCPLLSADERLRRGAGRLVHFISFAEL